MREGKFTNLMVSIVSIMLSIVAYIHIEIGNLDRRLLSMAIAVSMLGMIIAKEQEQYEALVSFIIFIVISLALIMKDKGIFI